MPLYLSFTGLFAQTPTSPPAAVQKIEPGLEEAVNWKWSVVSPTNNEWGMPLPESLQPKPASPTATIHAAAPAEPRPTTYAITKGDTLSRIALKFSMSVDQLKQFNEMKSDKIVIGQKLRIPTAAELISMAPPPVPPKPESPKTQKPDKPTESQTPAPYSYEQLELETVLLQVFMDREMFSSGAIDGNSGPMFQKISQSYQKSHADAQDLEHLKAKALATVKQPYTNYTLRAEDFKFIKPSPTSINKPANKTGKSGKSAAPLPPMSYQEIVAADFLAYRTAWEFVAERFHCDETFLRRINAKLAATPAVGAVFQVPNVIPFEIENAFTTPLQPSADPQKPIMATVVNLSLLEITREGQLVASIPISSARPGFRGRGSWTILDAIPRPRLASKHEPRETPKAALATAPGGTPAPAPMVTPLLETEQYIPSGPNNPVGIIWINLAKANSTTPLAYGLHGTSIPARMKSQEGIGGLRLTNWDIARVVRLLPAGTALQWKTQ